MTNHHAINGQIEVSSFAMNQVCYFGQANKAAVTLKGWSKDIKFLACANDLKKLAALMDD